MERARPAKKEQASRNGADTSRPFSLSGTTSFLKKALALMESMSRMAAEWDTDAAVNGMLEAVGSSWMFPAPM